MFPPRKNTKQRRYSGGRPSNFVPETRLAIKRALLAGNSYEGAAQAVGVRSSTLYRWWKLWPDWRQRCEKWRRRGQLRPVRPYGTNGANGASTSTDLVCDEQRWARLIVHFHKPGRQWRKDDVAWARALNGGQDEQLILRPEGFAEAVLGLKLYPWQADAVRWIQDAHKGRVNVAVVGPNGCGKDSFIIPTAAFWWLFVFPKGRVRITSKSATQLDTQTIPALDRHWRKFGWEAPISHPRFTLRTPTGGNLVAFCTNEGSRFEGGHGTPDSPLLDIVNEAKSIDADIFEGADRSSPDAQLLVSSPGLKEGRFYECFNKLKHLYHTVEVGLADCPHISADKIAAVESMYGPNHPITRSTLYGEFMDFTGDTDSFIPFRHIMDCEYGDDESWSSELALCRHPVFIGIDVARTTDLSVFFCVEKVGDTFFTRKLIALRGEPFETQEQRLIDLLCAPSVRRCLIDQSGLGRQLVERMIKKFPARVSGVNFTLANKELLAYGARAAFESRRIRIPRSVEIRTDIASIKQEATALGNVRFAAERTEGHHADYFWSCALALEASRTATQPFSLEGVRCGRALLPNTPRFTPRLLLPGRLS